MAFEYGGFKKIWQFQSSIERKVAIEEPSGSAAANTSITPFFL